MSSLSPASSVTSFVSISFSSFSEPSFSNKLITNVHFTTSVSPEPDAVDCALKLMIVLYGNSGTIVKQE